MEDKLTKEQVLHVANLGRLKVTPEEIEKYRYQLRQILDEIEKINNLDIEDSGFMISPTNNINVMNDGKAGNMLEVKEVLKNAPKTNGNYVSVPKVLND